MKKPSELQQRLHRNVLTLSLMLLLGGLYLAWFAHFPTLTGNSRLDGTLGMLLGLYICSHPSANMLDLLLFMNAEAREGIASTRSGQFWLGLNLLAFLAGWAVIFAGSLRFVLRSP
jgi:hypothetical protein